MHSAHERVSDQLSTKQVAMQCIGDKVSKSHGRIKSCPYSARCQVIVLWRHGIVSTRP